MDNTINVLSRGIKSIGGNNSFGILEFMLYIFSIVLLLFLIYYLVHIGNKYVDESKQIEISKQQILKYTLILLAILLLIIIVQFRGILLGLLSPFILGIALAYTINPLVKMLVKKGVSRLWGVLIIYFSFGILVLALSITIIPRMTEEIRNLLEELPKYSNAVYEYIYNIIIKYNRNIENLPSEFDGIKDMLNINISRVQGLIVNVITSITNSILRMFSRVLGLILIPILGFYFLKDAEEFKKGLILLIPRKIRKNTIALFKDIDIVLGGFIRGQLIVAAIVGGLTTISLMLLRVEFAVIVGLVAGIANIIPYFGPIIGIIPAVMFALMDSYMKAIWVVLIFTAIQQIESAILSPKIVGKSVGIHPVWVILSLVIGGRLYGLMGLLLAVPMAGIIKVLGKHAIKHITK